MERVVDRIAVQTDREEKLALLELGILAGGTRAAQLAKALEGRGLLINLEGTPVGDLIAQRNREVGREEARAETMAALLRLTYGDVDDLDGLAARLAVDGFDRNLERIVAREPIDQLRATPDSSVD